MHGHAAYSWERAPEEWLASLTDPAGPEKRRSQFLAQGQVRRRGLQRHLVLVIDGSTSMASRDLNPSRLELALTGLKNFISQFFDKNPLSQMQLVQMQEGVATIRTHLAGNPLQHIAELSKCTKLQGEASLQNALKVARASLQSVAQFGTREVLIIFGGLSSCDPGNIQSTIKTMARHKIKVSIIGLAAEVHLCKTIAQVTGGQYNVVLNEKHFLELLNGYSQPPKVDESELEQAKTKSSFIKMGFPLKVQGEITSAEFARKIGKAAPTEGSEMIFASLCVISN